MSTPHDIAPVARPSLLSAMRSDSDSWRYYQPLDRATTLRAVYTLFELGAAVNPPSGVPPLFHWVVSGFEGLHTQAPNPHRNDMLRCFLRLGADPERRGFPTGTAIQHHLDSSHYPDMQCIRILLEGGADVNGRHQDNGATHLIEACRIGPRWLFPLARMLLEYRADPNAAAENGWTALHYLAGKPSSETTTTLELLLRAGADVQARLPNGTTALHIAAQWYNDDTIALLLDAGADEHVADSAHRTPATYYPDCLLW